jgi:hypothetical protein
MSKRFVLGVVLCCLLPAAPARADDEAPGKPALVVRFNSLDRLTADARYLARLADREELFKQVESLLKARTGEKGLEGLDPKKPIGFYAHVGPNGIDSTGALLVPVADEKALLGQLENLDLKAKKDEGGVYSVTLDQLPFPVLFRFAKGYAFVTVGTPGNDKLLRKDDNLDPAIVFPSGWDGNASLTLHADRIPASLKELALGQAELRLADLKEKEEPGETKAQRAFRVAALDEIGARFKSILKDGGELDLRLDIDRKAGDLNLALGFAGKPGSPLAAEIAELGKVKSLGAGLTGPDCAMSVAAAVALPEKLRKALEPVIEEELKKETSGESNEAKREALGRVNKALMPTAKAAEFDGGAALRSPAANGTYTLVGVVRLKEGANLEKEFTALMKLQTAGPPAPQFTFDVDRAGAVKIHKVVDPKADANYRKLFGDSPIYFAFRDDALFVATGEKAVDALKEALAVAPGPGKLVQLEMSLSRLTKALAAATPGAAEAAKKAFADGKDADRVRLTLEGGPALQLRLTVKAPLITFFSELDKAQKKGE